MTRQEYYRFREELAMLNMVEKHLNAFDEFLSEYPAFKDMTVKECFEYFSNRQLEINNEIEKLVNIE